MQMFTTLVTEDSASGKLFWESAFSRLELIGEKFGNGEVHNNLLLALKNYGKALIALDYDQGLIPMLQILRDDTIDKSRIAFIDMESFEEVICNSEFILSKFPSMRDKVINYKEYLDASYKHTGKYFSSLLHQYVKVKSPLKNDGDRNVTKFYDKGMNNFKECFIDNCCKYNMQCDLYLSDNKMKNMLSNKYSELQKFI
jgi:hypothetical protein